MSLFSSFSSKQQSHVEPEKADDALNRTVDTALETTFDSSTVATADTGERLQNLTTMGANKGEAQQVEVSFSEPPVVQKRDDSPYRATVRLPPQDAPGSMATAMMAADDADDAEISTKEANYDDGATRLYSLIEKRKWDEALKLMKTLPVFAVNEQASTWVIRREKDGKLRWRLLPIHAAIIFRGPLDLVEALVTAYPAGARCKDDQGMLPAHLAFRNDAPDVIIDAILAANPGAIHVKDRKGRVPLTCAMGTNCTKKTRAKLLATYSSIAVANEKEQVAKTVSESLGGELRAVEDRHVAEVDELKKTYEADLVMNLATSKERDGLIEKVAASQIREGELEKRLEEQEIEAKLRTSELLHKVAEQEEASKMREYELTQKVEDLTKALEAMTAMRRAETQRFTEESSQWSRVSQDLIQKMTGLQTERDSVAEEVDKIKMEKERTAVQKDVLRESIDELVLSHRSLQAERDELVARNEELSGLMARTLAEQEGIHAIFNKLDQDMSAAATVRERMISAIAKQEADVYTLAAREHDVMRGILQRQRDEMEGCLARGGGGGGDDPNNLDGGYYSGDQGEGRAPPQQQGQQARMSRSRSASPARDRAIQAVRSLETPITQMCGGNAGRTSPSYAGLNY